tara:strand:- start:1143 stop:1478 length:336 start_codon:yes stop_codon:yes gene_type:complete
MESSLTSTLLNKGIIRKSTILKAKVVTGSVGNMAVNVTKELEVEGAVKSKGAYQFTCFDEFGNYYDVWDNEIEEIDGMPLDRLIDVYDLRVDGSVKQITKRGRKAKVPQLA